MTKIEDEKATIIDGTTGLVEIGRIDRLQAMSNGYYISSDERSAIGTVRYVFPSTAFGLLLMCVTYIIIRKQRMMGASALNVCAAFLLLALTPNQLICGAEKSRRNEPPSLDAVEADEVGAFCRRPDCAAANAAYLLLRMHGMPVDYSTLWSMLRPTTERSPSMLDVKRALVKHGLSVSIQRSGPGQELNRLLPFVTLLEGDRSGAHSFAIVLARDSQTLLVVRCGSVVVENMNIEQCRRFWSGVILVAEDPRMR